MRDKTKLLRITAKPTGQLLFLGWLYKDKVQETIDRYKHDYSIKVETLDSDKVKDKSK